MNWNDIGFVKSSKIRRKVLSEAPIPVTPSEISRKINSPISHISKALSELAERRLVSCKNPAARKGKLFVITIKGKQILKQIH